MDNVISRNISLVVVALVAVVLVAPFASHAITRTESRTQAANQRTAGTDTQGSTGGTGGTNGGQSGENADSTPSDNVNVNPDAAQAFFDELGFGDDSDGPPLTEDLDTGDTEEQVANVDAQNPGYGFLTILTSILSRFRAH